MNDKAYWLWLQKALGTGIKTDEIVSVYKTAKNIYSATPQERVRSGVFTEKQLEKLKKTPLDVVDGIIEDCRKCRCRILTPDDDRYPKKLLQIPDFPLVLYYHGNPDILKKRLTISLVGTRKATKTGLTVSYRLAKSLTKSGAVVVSGGACGIDGAAHLGALHADKETVAVLGCGFFAKYHDSVENLKDDILRKGLIITEYPPQTPPYGRNFPIRNRIISGLSYAVVVVECPARSGSAITARYAREQGREVFAIPGNVTNSDMTGTIDLIRNLKATAVYSCSDILSAFEFNYPDLIDYTEIDSSALHESTGEVDFSKVIYNSSKRKTKTSDEEKCEDKKAEEVKVKTKKEDLNLNENAKNVYEILSENPMHIDDIVRNIPSLTIGKIMVSLTQLEMKGLAVSDSGKKYRRK